MDKITRQVRIEHWIQIMNECLENRRGQVPEIFHKESLKVL